jgi:CDP-diacylglycerol--glycerol-3-phosphate 3-phosphatidyltransferase
LSITDFFDGYYARKFKQTSLIGAILDPLADKILCNGVLLVLSAKGILSFWGVYTIIVRDFFVSSMRELTALKGNKLFSSKPAKIKTFLTCIFIVCFLLFYNHQNDIILLRLSFLWYGIILLNITTCYHYVRNALS